MRTTAATLLLILSAFAGVLRAADGPDFKDAINGYVRALRATQNADGSYGVPGDQPLATARMLLALGDCPEKYVVQDGPFVRRAVTALLAHQDDEGAFAPAGAKQRIAVTAESLLGLSATAKAGFEEELAAARAFLLGAPAEAIAAEQAQELVRFALAGRVEGAPTAARLAPRGDRDAAGAWVVALAEGFLGDPALAAEGIRTENAAAAIDRLLVMVEAQQALDAAKASTPRPLAEVTLREVPKDDAERAARIREAFDWLAAHQQGGRFAIAGVEDPGISAIALAAAAKTADRLGIERPEWIAAGFDWLVSLQKEDGAIYVLGLKNYVTSAAIEALVAARDPRYEESIAKAVQYLKASQLDEDEGYSSESDPYYGGFGYGSSEKPDLSNTQMALQALHEAGVPTTDAAFQKAVAFLQRCQNRTESGAPPITVRDGTVVVPGNDGGANYRPGDSKAGTDPVPGDPGMVVARSYGSMTYALLKSYLFSGLDPSDPRVAAAFEWICRNFTVEVNPGFKIGARKDAPYQGLFYYYLTLARALEAYDAAQVVDGEGRSRDWRRELETMLFQLQSADGSWTNARSSRWLEEDPALVTGYALLALAEL
jgi:squalene-hopene/tetraprenyl-beta-curcumene cyclase